MSKLNKTSSELWQLQGAFDRHSLPALWQELNQFPASSELQLDLAFLSRIDSAGLAALLRLKLNAERAGVKISFLNAPKQAVHLAQMSNVANMMALS